MGFNILAIVCGDETIQDGEFSEGYFCELAMVADVPYGLMAGIYGTEEEAVWLFDSIEAGAC